MSEKLRLFTDYQDRCKKMIADYKMSQEKEKQSLLAEIRYICILLGELHVKLPEEVFQFSSTIKILISDIITHPDPKYHYVLKMYRDGVSLFVYYLEEKELENFSRNDKCPLAYIHNINNFNVKELNVTYTKEQLQTFSVIEKIQERLEQAIKQKLENYKKESISYSQNEESREKRKNWFLRLFSTD